jgi:hypothetical protein
VSAATAHRAAFLLLLGLVGCAASRPAPTPVVDTPRATGGPSGGASRVPALSAKEQRLSEDLRGDVEWLAGDIGERHLEREWQLASAADGLFERLTSYGYTVERHGVVAGDAVAQNLEVVIRGGAKRGGQQVVVGAHYDTHPGSPGADDNASGVAALLALGRAFKDLRPDRTLRLVFFCNEEQPHFQTLSMGSLVYAKDLVAQHAEVVGMISLESIGYYSDAPGSQRYPAELASRTPEVGNFVAVIANDASRSLLDRVAGAMKDATTVPVVADALPVTIEGVGASDHWSFWQVGYPAVMITATAPFRNPHYHRATDQPHTLDYARFARVVGGIEAAVRTLVGTEASTES